MLLRNLFVSIQKRLFVLSLLNVFIVQAQSNIEFTQGTKEYGAGNYTKALEWYEQAAEKGDANSMYNLGWMYENGEGTDVNSPKAMEWYRKAIAKGHTDAMLALGIIYFNADMDQEAENCLKMAADNSNTNAYSVLGFFYFLGERYEEAVPWLKMAAEENNPEALYMLGEIYENGYEVIQDENKALQYYEKAAGLGYDEAIEKLNGN